jgi:hypothetical protein
MIAMDESFLLRKKNYIDVFMDAIKSLSEFLMLKFLVSSMRKISIGKKYY